MDEGNNKEVEKHYSFNNVIYNVAATRDVHYRLQNDM